MHSHSAYDVLHCPLKMHALYTSSYLQLNNAFGSAKIPCSRHRSSSSWCSLLAAPVEAWCGTGERAWLGCCLGGEGVAGAGLTSWGWCFFALASASASSCWTDLHSALRHPIPIFLCLISATREEEIEGEEGRWCCSCYAVLAFSKILILVVRRAGAGASSATTWGQGNPESHQGRKLFSLFALLCSARSCLQRLTPGAGSTTLPRWRPQANWARSSVLWWARQRTMSGGSATSWRAACCSKAMACMSATTPSTPPPPRLAGGGSCDSVVAGAVHTV
jgi:hypothetical protein